MLRHWILGLAAVLLLAIAGAPPPALALPAPVPAGMDPAATDSTSPCHGSTTAAVTAGDEQTREDAQKAPGCCPDGCPGHCLTVSALPPAPPSLPADVALARPAGWAPSPLLSLPASPAERPPRA